MADSYNVKKITELAAKSASDDTDLYVIGNQGTATMRKISFATIAAAIRDKLTSLTFPSLNTSNKTLPGAVNELNSKSGTVSITSGDLNDRTDQSNSGLYGVYSNITNSPINYGGLLNSTTSSGVHQLAYNKTGMYVRSRTGSPATWSDWIEFMKATSGELSGSSANLNTLLGVTGFYYVGADVQNSPTNYCMLISLARSGSTVTFQLAFKGANLYTRAYTGSPLAWTSWKSYS